MAGEEAEERYEEENLPIINNVRLYTESDSSADDSDEFSASASEIRKEISGVSPNFKRNLTNKVNKLEKRRQGVEGTKSKLAEENSATGYASFDVAEPPYNFSSLVRLYAISPPHQAAVNAKVSNIVGLGYTLSESKRSQRKFEELEQEGKEKFLETKKNSIDELRDELYEFLDDLNEEDSFIETMMKVWTDYEITGNGYLEIGRMKDGTIGYIGHAPAKHIRIRNKRDGYVQMAGFEVVYFAPYGKAQEITNPVSNEVPNEIIHFRNYSPESTYYGVPDIIPALSAVIGNDYASKFNLDHFEHKAIPRYAIILKGATMGNKAEESLMTFLQSSLKGKNHRSIYIPLPSGTKDKPVELNFEKIEADIQDSSFNNYRKANQQDILMAHRVPATKVTTSEGIALAIARDADKTFKEQTCRPRQKIVEKKLNKVFREFTDKLDFHFNELTLTDADTQSKIDERQHRMGALLPNEIRNREGKQSIRGGNQPFNPNAKYESQENDRTATRQRDAERSASETDAIGEGRNPKGEGRTSGE